MAREKRIIQMLDESPFLYHLISKKTTKHIKRTYGVEYPILMICLGLDVGRTLGVLMNSRKIRCLYRSIFTNQATDKAILTGTQEGFYTLEDHPTHSKTRVITLTVKGEKAIRDYKEYTFNRTKEIYLDII